MTLQHQSGHIHVWFNGRVWSAKDSRCSVVVSHRCYRELLDIINLSHWTQVR